MRKIALVVFVVPVVISFIFGGAVLADVLGQPDRQLNFWQFKFVPPSNQVGDKDIKIVNLLDSYPISKQLNFTVWVNDTTFNCGDLYLTIYNTDASPEQVVAQNAYFSQCFAQSNSTMPINDVFSPNIGTPGTYHVVAEMKDKSYQNSLNVTGSFKVQ